MRLLGVPQLARRLPVQPQSVHGKTVAPSPRTPSDPESADETLAIIDVAKNRNGETGEVRVNFIREFTRFCDREIPHGEDTNFQTSEPPPTQGEFVEDPNM